MRENDSFWAGILRIAASLILLCGISLSVNQFVLSLRIMNLKHRTSEGEILFSNSGDFSRFFFSSVFLLFLVLYLLVTIQGMVLRRRSMRPWPEILWKQSLAYFPFLLLVFSAFFTGKAVHFIILIPLLPLFFALILVVSIVLNLKLHSKLVKKLNDSLFNSSDTRIAVFLLIVFALVFIHFLTIKPYFERFNSHKLFIGDEPKYLRMTNSLAVDKDLDLTNDFEDVSKNLIEMEKKEILESGSRRFGYLSIIGKDGGIYHLHMPGLSFILLPGYLLDKTFFTEVPQGSPHPYYFPERLFFFKLMDSADWNNYFTCLLYTSPSPRDRTRSRMPSSA